MANDLVINPKTIFSELQRLVPQMDAALPRHIPAERMARIALTQLRINPKLMQCTPESFFASMMVASQVGLEPGINGQCYLIPYRTTCTFVPGWRGHMELLSRTGRASAWTNAIYDGDEFDYGYGDKPFIHHKPGKWSGKEGAMIYSYSVGRQKDAEWPVIEVWDIDKIWDHRDKNNKLLNKNEHYSFKYPEMYARKIPLLQVIKYLPSSVELANLSALDIVASEGRQKLTLNMALKGHLETGGATDDPSDLVPPDEELDALFEKLNKNQTERDLLRKSYEGKRDELVALLTSKLPTASAAAGPADAKPKRTRQTAEKASQGVEAHQGTATTIVTETKQYTDGSSATGPAPLPDQSPAHQAAAAKKIEHVEVTEDMLSF